MKETCGTYRPGQRYFEAAGRRSPEPTALDEALPTSLASKRRRKTFLAACRRWQAVRQPGKASTGRAYRLSEAATRRFFNALGQHASTHHRRRSRISARLPRRSTDPREPIGAWLLRRRAAQGRCSAATTPTRCTKRRLRRIARPTALGQTRGRQNSAFPSS